MENEQKGENYICYLLIGALFESKKSFFLLLERFPSGLWRHPLVT